MIIKITDGILNTLGEGTLTEFHISKGYKEVLAEDIETKEDGTYYDFYNEDLTPDLGKIQEAEDLRAVQEAKKAKIELLKTITVTTEAGNTFDGDDIARADMLSAIQASETLGQDTAMWKLSDNTWAEIDLDEMREASALAIQAKGKILSGDSDV